MVLEVLTTTAKSFWDNFNRLIYIGGLVLVIIPLYLVNIAISPCTEVNIKNEIDVQRKRSPNGNSRD